MTKKTTSKAAAKKTSSKAAPKKVPAKKTRRPSASADSAAKTKRALAQAKTSVDANLKAIAAADQENARTRDHRAASTDGMTASERAMAETEPPKKRAGKPAAKKVSSDRKPSGLDLAAKVLAEAGEPLAAKAIAERAIAAGWTTEGKTPHATLYAAMAREITTKGSESRFAKTGRGLFEATGKGGS